MKDDPATGKRVVAGTHWDFDSYGGTIKKKLGMPAQVHCLIVLALTPLYCTVALHCCFGYDRLAWLCWHSISHSAHLQCTVALHCRFDNDMLAPACLLYAVLIVGDSVQSLAGDVLTLLHISPQLLTAAMLLWTYMRQRSTPIVWHNASQDCWSSQPRRNACRCLIGPMIMQQAARFLSTMGTRCLSRHFTWRAAQSIQMAKGR